MDADGKLAALSSAALEQPMGLQDMHNESVDGNAGDGPPAKRARPSPSRAPLPLPNLPRDGKLLVLDIDGCMTDQDYARRCHETYVRKHMSDYLVSLPEIDLRRMIRRMERQMPQNLWDEVQSEMQRLRRSYSVGPGGSDAVLVIQTTVQFLHQKGIQIEELLSIQGQVWKAGRRRSSMSPNNNIEGAGLEGHIYPDFVPLLRICRTMGISVCLYAEPSITEQMQMIRLSSQGDLNSFVSGYFDTVAATADGHNASVGSKTEPNSYRTIAQRMNADIKDVVVLSVNEKELEAAKAAGAQAVLRLRPADWSNVKDADGSFPACCSMMQLFDSESR